MPNRITLAVSVAFVAFIVFEALGPAKIVPRSGLGWQFDHFAGYLVLSSMLCAAWRRPFVIGAFVTSFAITLEIFQGFTPDRLPDVMGAFFSISGVLTATLLADLMIGSRKPMIGWALHRSLH